MVVPWKVSLLVAVSRRQAELILVGVTVIWGGTFSVTKDGLGDASPLLFLGIRFLTAWVLLSLLVPSLFRRINRKNLKHGVFLGLLMFFGYGLQNMGLVHTTAGRSGFITYTFALYVPLLQFLIIRQMPHKGNLAGLAVVTLGMILLAGSIGGSLNRGDLLSLLSALSFAFYIVSLDLLTKKSDTWILTNLQFLVAGVLSLVIAPLVEDVHFVPSPRLFLGIAYLAVLGSVVAVSLMTRYQKYLSPTKAVLIYAMEPVFSVIVATLFFAEMFSIREGIGSAVILAGVFLSELWGQKKAALVPRDNGETF